jgi:hypothetical protein
MEERFPMVLCTGGSQSRPRPSHKAFVNRP